MKIKAGYMNNDVGSVVIAYEKGINGIKTQEN
jgi:hypothetical protein